MTKMLSGKEGSWSQKKKETEDHMNTDSHLKGTTHKQFTVTH